MRSQMQPLVDAWCADLDLATRTLPNLTMVLIRCRTGTATQRRQLIQSLSRLTARLRPFADLISATDSEDMTEDEATADADTSDVETSDAENTDADEGDTAVVVCISADSTTDMDTVVFDDEASKEHAAMDTDAQYE